MADEKDLKALRKEMLEPIKSIESRLRELERPRTVRISGIPKVKKQAPPKSP